MWSGPRTALQISYRDPAWFEQTPYFQYARVGRKYAEAAGYGVDINGSAYSFDYMVREAAGEVPRSALDWEVPVRQQPRPPGQRRPDLCRRGAQDREGATAPADRGDRYPPGALR